MVNLKVKMWCISSIVAAVLYKGFYFLQFLQFPSPKMPWNPKHDTCLAEVLMHHSGDLTELCGLTPTAAQATVNAAVRHSHSSSYLLSLVFFNLPTGRNYDCSFMHTGQHPIDVLSLSFCILFMKLCPGTEFPSLHFMLAQSLWDCTFHKHQAFHS